MIISIITIILIIALHLFPKRIREKVLGKLKRFFVRIRNRIRSMKDSKR